MASIESTIKDVVDKSLKPERSTGLPGASATELEDTGWFDFTEVNYLFEPAEQLPAPSMPNAGPSALDLDAQIYLEELGTPSNDYAQFSGSLRAYLQQAVIDILVQFKVRIIGPYSSRYEPSYDEDARILTFIPDNDPDVYMFQLSTITYDIGKIVDLMLFVPPFELIADIADIYFSIDYADAATTFFAKQTFFSKIYQFFTSGNGDYQTAAKTADVLKLLNTGSLTTNTGDNLTMEERLLGYWNALYQYLAAI